MIEFKTRIVFDPPNITKKHKSQSSWKKIVICETNCDMHLYYAWFLKTRFNLILNRPLRNPHVTIVNDKIDDLEHYNLVKTMFHNKELTFKYDPAEIRSNGEHWWIKIYSDDIENIRSVMGLTLKPYFNLHLTIGYVTEGIRLEHSKYILETITTYNL
jgi:hypothetical protein